MATTCPMYERNQTLPTLLADILSALYQQNISLSNAYGYEPQKRYWRTRLPDICFFIQIKFVFKYRWTLVIHINPF